MPDKIKKEAKSIILVFYQGGTKLKAATTHTKEELKARIEAAKKNVTDCEIDTVNEDDSVSDDVLFLTRNGLLFYSIQIPKQVSNLVIAPANALPNNGVSVVR